MPKIPFEVIKELGQKGFDYAKKNPGKVIATVGMATPKVMKTLTAISDKKHEWQMDKIKKKSELGKIDFKETRYLNYHSKVLPNITTNNYSELDEHISEVENFIIQLENEMTVIKKLLITSKITKWQKVKAQLESRRDNSFYYELVKLNEEATYESSFLPMNVQDHFRELPTLEARKEFVMQFTDKEASKVGMDFLKYN